MILVYKNYPNHTGLSFTYTYIPCNDCYIHTDSPMILCTGDFVMSIHFLMRYSYIVEWGSLVINFVIKYTLATYLNQVVWLKM